MDPHALLAPVDLLLVGTVAFVVHRYFNRAPDRSPAAVYRMRAVGALLLGAIPLAITVALTGLDPEAVGLCRGRPEPALRILGPLTPVILWLVARGARGAVARGEVPSVLRPRSTLRDHVLDGATWLIYLSGYELLFRGILLLGLVPTLGTSAAIAVSTSLYVLAHLHKGAGETLGSLPVGLLLASATVQSGSIAGAVVVHTLIVLTADWRGRAIVAAARDVDTAGGRS